ncbi:MAG: hypothetical protein IJ416_11545 [Ruminiclostridium sp.]|nr:hypothetical protein [Ruminiclostridium sp.]
MKIIADDRDLLSDNGLDEMQKTYAYKLAFKCFKALYWSVFALSLIMFFLAITEESLIFSIAALVIELVDCIIYVVFGAKASKVGAMNPKFAQNMAKPSVIISYFVLAVIYTIMYIKNFMKDGDFFFIFFGIYLLIFCGHFIALGFISKKNNKVIEETEED